MKKVMLGLLCMAVCFVLTMSCDIPQSITFKGSPGLHISLGRLSDLLEDQDQRLESYLSFDRIKEMMDAEDTGNKVNVYQYQNPLEVQTYIVHYPIADMRLDLSEYIDDVMKSLDEKTTYELPEELDNPDLFSGDEYFLTENGYETSHSEYNPTFTIPLADMVKLVKDVKGTTSGLFGIEIEDPEQKFDGSLSLYIPAFGVGTSTNYLSGTRDNDKLRFVGDGKSNDKTFTPVDDLRYENNDNSDELRIYAKLTGPASGRFTIGMVFNWTEANVNTKGSDRLTGEYELTNSLGEFLGKGVNFKKIEGYIYIHGIGNTEAKMTLTVGGDPVNGIDNTDLTEREKPSFTKDQVFTGSFPSHSIDDLSSIDLTGILNEASKVAQWLEYKIEIDTIDITNGGDNDKAITIDLVIVIPLEFEVSALDEAHSVTIGNSQYVKLDLGNILPKLGDKDLFGRDSGDENDLFNSIDIKLIQITLLKKLNSIIDESNLFIRVLNQGNQFGDLLDFSKAQPSMKSTDGIPDLFAPEFEILLKKTNSTDASAPLKMKHQSNPDAAIFDFILDVEARTTIKFTMDLEG